MPDAKKSHTWPGITYGTEINLVQATVVLDFLLLAAESSLTGAELGAKSGVLTRKAPKHGANCRCHQPGHGWTER